MFHAKRSTERYFSEHLEVGQQINHCFKENYVFEKMRRLLTQAAREKYQYMRVYSISAWLASIPQSFNNESYRFNRIDLTMLEWLRKGRERWF